MQVKNLSGVGVAIVTPFKRDKSVDFDRLKMLVDFVIDGGVNFIVILGTTGESVTLSLEERKQITSTIKTQTNQRVPLVLGAGSYSTSHVLDLFSVYNFEDIDAILSVTPYYNKPNQNGLYEHYKELALHSPKPIILYNVPGRTGVNLSAETTLKLAEEFETIAAVKEASGNLEQISKIIAHKPEGFKVFSGDDALTLPSIAIGADGVISVIANAYPAQMSQMVSYALNSNLNEAQKLHHQLMRIIPFVFKEGNPVGIKAVMYLKNLLENELRLPLVPASNELIEDLKKYV